MLCELSAQMIHAVGQWFAFACLREHPVAVLKRAKCHRDYGQVAHDGFEVADTKVRPTQFLFQEKVVDLDMPSFPVANNYLPAREIRIGGQETPGAFIPAASPGNNHASPAPEAVEVTLHQG